jgi:GMP synthase (glutamine-hydrolysing)
MPKLLVFQHIAHEILGTLDPLLRRERIRIRYVNFERHPDARPTLDGYDGVVVLGGPMNVDQADRYPHLRHEMDVIREALDRDRPVLGICLGAQLLAHALGANVGRAPQREIGWYDVGFRDHARADALLGHVAPVERLFQWHGDAFELPRGAVPLASSSACPNQAFRYGDRAWGFQFHLEVDEPMIERWLRAPANQAEIAASDGEICPDRIRRETSQRIERQLSLGERAFSSFVDVLRSGSSARATRAA